MALFWHRNIKVLPSITFSFLENFYKINCLVVSTTNKAYKFFMEGYIHEFEGNCLLCLKDILCNVMFINSPVLYASFNAVANTPQQCFIRAKCFRSQRRNDPPHDIKVA
jgi:hypothetical protein